KTEGVIIKTGLVGLGNSTQIGSINGLQSGAFIQLPGVSVEFVGTTLVHNIGNRGAAATEFRGVRILQDRNFLNSIRVGRLKRLALNGVVIIVLAIEKEVVLAW